jgi:hypothetical protein
MALNNNQSSTRSFIFSLVGIPFPINTSYEALRQKSVGASLGISIYHVITDRNHNFLNIVSTERWLVYMEVLLVLLHISYEISLSSQSNSRPSYSTDAVLDNRWGSPIKLCITYKNEIYIACTMEGTEYKYKYKRHFLLTIPILVKKQYPFW